MLSVIVPLFNERDSLGELVARIDAIRSQVADVEVFLVDDGSTDGSWDRVVELADEYKYVRGLRFRRNFGKAAALTAGFEEARGDIVITMDADLQDDPSEIPRLVSKLQEGYDVVSGWKQTRHDPWHKRWPSFVFNTILRRFSRLELHDFNCGLKAYRKQVLGEIDIYGEMHRYIPVLAAARGFRIAELAVLHHARQHGSSKYGWSRIPKGLLDLLTVVFLTRFRYRPQHLLGGLGGAICGIGIVVLFALIVGWAWTRLAGTSEPLNLHERALFYLSILMIIVGIQFFGVGLLAELVVANSTFRRSPFSIAARTRTNPSHPANGD
jgi:glycosyltransferase involved in cell wall biosynthesis